MKIEDITQSVAYYTLINYLAGNLLSDLEVQCLISYAKRRFNNTTPMMVYRWESELSQKQNRQLISTSTTRLTAKRAGRTYFTQQILESPLPKNARKKFYRYRVMDLEVIPLLTTTQIETLINEFYATDRYQPKRYVKTNDGKVVYAIPWIGRNKKTCLETLEKEKEVIILREDIRETIVHVEGRCTASNKSIIKVNY